MNAAGALFFCFSIILTLAKTSLSIGIEPIGRALRQYEHDSKAALLYISNRLQSVDNWQKMLPHFCPIIFCLLHFSLSEIMRNQFRIMVSCSAPTWMNVIANVSSRLDISGICAINKDRTRLCDYALSCLFRGRGRRI